MEHSVKRKALADWKPLASRREAFSLECLPGGIALRASTVDEVLTPRVGASVSPATRKIAIATWRFVAFGLLAFWQGGFMFYGGVVIAAAHRVLGSHLEVGFITQRVTNWLNVIGAATLIVLAANLLIGRRTKAKMLRWTLAGTWVVMAVALIALAITHPMLDRVLDANSHDVLDHARFGQLHKVYLGVATIQWGAAMLHLWGLMVGTTLVGERQEVH